MKSIHRENTQVKRTQCLLLVSIKQLKCVFREMKKNKISRSLIIIVLCTHQIKMYLSLIKV